MHYVYVNPCGCRYRRRSTDYPGLSIMIYGYTLFSILYVIKIFSWLPRSGYHDAAVGIGFIFMVMIWGSWHYVKRIPLVGPVIYYLPGLALAITPLALDLYLMFVR